MTLELPQAKDHAARSLPGEVWMPVPSEPGVLASSFGRILQPPRYTPMHHGGYRAYLPKPVYGQKTRSKKAAAHVYYGTLIFDSGKSAKQKPRKVHQLVCEAFHGPRPFDGAVVIHIDENALNNRPENLKWGTQKENLNMPKFTAWKQSMRGEKHWSALRKAEASANG